MSVETILFSLNINYRNVFNLNNDLYVDKTLKLDKIRQVNLTIDQIMPKSLNINTKTGIEKEL